MCRLPCGGFYHSPARAVSATRRRGQRGLPGVRVPQPHYRIVRGCRGLKAARYAPAWACWGCGCPCLQCVFILLCAGRRGRFPDEEIPDAAYQPFLFLRPGCPQQPLTTCDSRSLQASESCAVVNPFGFCSKAASSCCVASFSCSLVSLTAFHPSAPIGAGWGFLSCGAGAGQG